MKVTMYELLGLVKDDKAPKKIKYKNIIWYFNKKNKNYYMNNTKIELFYIEKLTEKLNDEVEILEEEKKIPEKILEEIIVGKKQPTHRIKKIEKKINEIIDYLDYLKSKGE